jgi:hypothetical protein
MGEGGVRLFACSPIELGPILSVCVLPLVDLVVCKVQVDLRGVFKHRIMIVYIGLNIEGTTFRVADTHLLLRIKGLSISLTQ